jgi:hypothetical protein
MLELLTYLGMLACRPKHLALPLGLTLVTNMDFIPIDPHLYLQIVGKFIFLTTTRTDITYATNTANR